MKSSWIGEGGLKDRVDSLQKAARVWNKDVFGVIMAHKKNSSSTVHKY